MTITAKKAKQLMDHMPESLTLDVRTPEEFSEGHLPGAMLVPYDELPQRAEQVLPDKNRTIFVYCLSGARSKRAANTLEAKGYTHVYEIGGIMNWPYEIVK